MSVILPEELIGYFELISVDKGVSSIIFHLDEKNIIPEEYKKDKLESKGFFEPITVQDFPIRGKTVYLKIRRRRWINKANETVVYRDWNLIAKGTRISTEFAFFFEGLAKRLSN